MTSTGASISTGVERIMSENRPGKDSGSKTGVACQRFDGFIADRLALARTSKSNRREGVGVRLLERKEAWSTVQPRLMKFRPIRPGQLPAAGDHWTRTRISSNGAG